MFESLGEKIANIGGTVKSGTANVIENTKRGVNNFSETVALKNKIENAKKSIKESYYTIGEKFYNENKDNTPAGYEQIFAEIAAANKTIAEAEAQIATIGDSVVCPNCGSRVNKENAFCTNCGHKMVENKTVELETKKCTSCGEDIPVDAAFCSRCGAKVENDGE